MNIVKKSLLTIAGIAASAQALAHADHSHSIGGVFANLMHQLTEPDHLAMIITGVVVAVVGYKSLKKKSAEDSKDF
ncbi:HupE/UreJ family protein [Bacterioplanoides sp.]|uniref:HupE/UreJ family protein n=1 Tax=Bacterioplanoides sp. TaxID=2066072 RepID=UPI003AFFB79F